MWIDADRKLSSLKDLRNFFALYLYECFRDDFKLWKNLKYWTLEEAGTIYKQKLAFSRQISTKYTWQSHRKWMKLNKTKTLWHLLSPNFWPPLPNTYLWREAGYYNWSLPKILTFVVFPIFQRFYFLSQTTVFMLNFKSRFTCGKSKMC